MRRALTLVDLLVGLAAAGILLCATLPILLRLRSQGAESVSIANLQTLSFAHAMYAWDWNDRQVTWVPDEAGVYTLKQGSSNWYTAWLVGVQDCPSQQVLGWEDDPTPTIWGYWLPCDGFPGQAGNAVAYEPCGFTPSNTFGSFRLFNAVAFHAYVDGRFYSETFYSPTDTKTWELASPMFDFDGSFSIIPPLGEGGLPSIVNSSYCPSPAAMWGPEVLSLNTSTGEWYMQPWKSATGYQSPSVSQCAYPDLKTRTMEHNWNVGQPDAVSPKFTGKYTPYFFNHGLAAAPVTLFFDGHVALLPNAKVVDDDAAVLDGTGGAIGLWTRDTPLGAKGYYGAQAYDDTLVSHHILTADGILGRDVLDTMAAQGLDGDARSTREAPVRRSSQSTTGSKSPTVRPPGMDPEGLPW